MNCNTLGWLPSLLMLSHVYGLVPVQIPFSSKSYSLDGPWNAVSVSVGDPPQEIDLLPAAVWWTDILAPTICDNATFSTLGIDCYARDAGLYSNDSSDTAYYPPGDRLGWPSWTTTLPMNGTLYAVMDILTFGQSTVNNISILLADDAWETYPSGMDLPVSIGQLSLGAPAKNRILDGVEASLPPNWLFNNGKTPSASFGLHIGSAAPLIDGGIPGSLWFGVEPLAQSLSQPMVPGGKSFGIDLQAISFSDGTTQQGNLLQSKSTSEVLSMSTTPWNPYLVLPRAVCDAMAHSVKNQNISMDSTGYYLWDANKDSLKNSTAYFTFTLSSSGTIDIKVPIQLLYLTLLPPIVSSSSPYFPCLPNDDPDQYALGQAFLQAVLMGANWQPESGQPYWFMAQAPGPGAPATPFVTSILASDTSSTAYEGLDANEWETTWSSVWGISKSDTSTSSGTTSNTSTSPPAKGLPTGAKAGIAIGVVATVLATVGLSVFFFLRRRKQTSQDVATEHKHAELAGSDDSGSATPHAYSAVSTDHSPGSRFNPLEMPAEHFMVELPVKERPMELPNRTNELRAELL